MTRQTWQERYTRRFYGPERGWVDGTTEFFRLCGDWIAPAGRILEVGPGPTNPTSAFLATLGELHGIDIDADAANNRWLRQCHVMVGDRFPVDDGSFDAVVSNYVCEHVKNPAAHLQEVARALRPGGTYILRTPNLYHYVSQVSLRTPFWFHRLVANRLRNHAADHHDPYPTFYAMNSVKRLSELAADAGLTVRVARLVEKEPSYGLSARPLFLAFMGYERLVNSTDKLGFLRSNIFAVLQKPQ